MLSDFEKIEQINRLNFRKKIKSINSCVGLIDTCISLLIVIISGVIVLFTAENYNRPCPPLYYTGSTLEVIFITNLCISIFGFDTQNKLKLIPCLILKLGLIIYLMYLIISAAYYEHLYFEHLFYTIVLFVKIQNCIFICVQIKYKSYSMSGTNYKYLYSKILNQKPNKKQNTEYCNLIIEYI